MLCKHCNDNNVTHSVSVTVTEANRNMIVNCWWRIFDVMQVKVATCFYRLHSERSAFSCAQSPDVTSSLKSVHSTSAYLLIHMTYLWMCRCRNEYWCRDGRRGGCSQAAIRRVGRLRQCRSLAAAHKSPELHPRNYTVYIWLPLACCLAIVCLFSLRFRFLHGFTVTNVLLAFS